MTYYMVRNIHGQYLSRLSLSAGYSWEASKAFAVTFDDVRKARILAETDRSSVIAGAYPCDDRGQCVDCGTAHSGDHACEPINWTYGK